MFKKTIFIIFSLLLIGLIASYVIGVSDKVPKKDVPKSSPENTLSKLITDLKTGNIESALSKFEPSQMNSDFFSSFNPETVKDLATWFEKSYIVESSDDYRVYRYEWVDETGDNSAEFEMTLDSDGNWLISSW